MSHPIEILAEIAQGFEADTDTASGEIQENKFEVKLNDFEHGEGISAEFKLMFDGPELAKEQEIGSSIFPDKTADDLLTFTSIKVKGDAEEALTELQTLIESMGITSEMWAPFAELEFKAGDGEILIGGSPANEEIIGVISPFMINPTFMKGDGSEDISITTSVDFAATCDQFLNDEPIFSHFLKGISVSAVGRLFLNSRDILIKILNEQWDKVKPLAEQFPVLAPILLFKRLEGEMEFQCDDAMREELKEALLEIMPPVVMSLPDALGLVKMQGMVPMEMAEPVLNWFNKHFDGQVRVYFQRSIGMRMTFNLPGLDQVVNSFLEN